MRWLEKVSSGEDESQPEEAGRGNKVVTESLRVSPPLPVLAVGITGHRAKHPSVQGREEAIRDTLGELFCRVEGSAKTALGWLSPLGATTLSFRVISMLGDGVDRWGAHAGLDRGWESVVALPFGLELTYALGQPPVENAEQLEARLHAAAAVSVCPETFPANPRFSFRGRRAPSVRFAATSPASGGGIPCGERGVIPPPLAGEVARRAGGGLRRKSSILDFARIISGRTLRSAPNELDGEGADFVDLAQRSRVFALAEQDDEIIEIWKARVAAPPYAPGVDELESATSMRYALAARIIVEQSDLLVAVWDGVTRHSAGGTGDTIARALAAGVPVLWINPANVDNVRLLTSPEQQLHLERSPSCGEDQFNTLVRSALFSPMNDSDEAVTRLARFLRETGKTRNSPLWVGYRFIEKFLGGAEHPTSGEKLGRTMLRIEFGTADSRIQSDWGTYLQVLSSVCAAEESFAEKVSTQLGRRFAIADSIATNLSDAFRGAMVTNFALAVAAVLIGLLYLPVTTLEYKWIYVLLELVIVMVIVAVTVFGVHRKWHARWLDTRRVAEYLRHERVFAPLGVGRPVGSWPQAVAASWPEWFARQALRQVGLPVLTIGKAELRILTRDIVLTYVDTQREYHVQKAARLHQVHRRLDRISIVLFILAGVAGAGYLSFHWLFHEALGEDFSSSLSKWFTFLGVAFPMCAATASGVRYFGDFERFAVISDVARENLTGLSERLQALIDEDKSIDYESVSGLARAAEAVFIEELKSWQAIFSGKHMSVPV